MPPDLSVQAPDELARDVASRQALTSTTVSRFEQGIIEKLCEPLLPLIPPSVHPNTISLWTHLVAWVTLVLALVAVHLSPLGRSLALGLAGLGMLVSMIGDCIDGMHARRTNQCSKLGEMMDHWLDALIVPMVPIGITMALQMEPWAIIAVNITAAMVYHSQLVLYHHTGKFLQPDAATGVEAQFGVSVGYVALAVFYTFVDRQQLWLDVAIGIVAVIGLIIQMRCNWFYYTRLGQHLGRHFIFVALCAGFALLYLLSIIDLYTFLMALIFTSFRVSGTYVLRTLLGRPYDGHDLGIALWILAILGAHYLLPPIPLGPATLQALLPYGAILYMIGRNLLDFAHHYPLLKPKAV